MSESDVLDLISVADAHLINASVQSSRVEEEIGSHHSSFYNKDFAIAMILDVLKKRGVVCEQFYSLKYALTHLLKRFFKPLSDDDMASVMSFYEADRNSHGVYGLIVFDNGIDFVIPGSPMRIGRGCFLGARYRSIVVPDSVVDIDDYSFFRCSCSRIFLGSSVRSIGECCFQDCTYLRFLDIPNRVSSIGKDAFLYTGTQNDDEPIAVFHRAKVEVEAIEHYPWGLLKGRIIRCSDGDLIVGEA